MQDNSLTPKGILMDLRLREAGEQGLLDLIEARRREVPRTPWRTIAAELREKTGLHVTDMGVRYWLAKAGRDEEVAA